MISSDKDSERNPRYFRGRDRSSEAPPAGREDGLDSRDIERLIFNDSEGLYRLRFKSAIEEEYRAVASVDRKYPRIILFLAFFICFAIAPYYQTAMFEVTAAAQHRVWMLDFIAATLTLIGAAATYFGKRSPLVIAIQIITVAALFITVLNFRDVALKGGMLYPNAIIGLTALFIAVFGGFYWYLLVPVIALTYAFSVLQDFFLYVPTADASVNTNVLACMMILAVMGAYVIEVAHRRLWITARSAATLARTDVVTGLANRAEFIRSFPRILRQATREQLGVAIAMVDIDHFKRINDRYGHVAGDAVLKATGDALKQAASRRPLDILARFGGEEFIAVWFGAEETDLTAFSETLLRAIRSMKIDLPGGEVIDNVTASLGIFWLVPGAGADQDEIVRKADHLMYQAKTEGRDRALCQVDKSSNSKDV